MNLVLALLIVVSVTAITVTIMLLVRRRAPEGGYFADGDRAAGVFGVLATGFSVLLGLIIFLAFQSYDDARVGGEDEATIVGQMVQTAQLMPASVSDELTGELVCYARSVAGAEWDALDAGTLGDTSINPWGARMFVTLEGVEPQSASEQSAYDKWMDQTTDRQVARTARTHTAQGIIPVPLWIALLVICAVIFGYMLFFADRGERAITQAMLMGSLTVVITLMMLLVVFFNHPHGEGIGTLKPTAMERTLRLIDEQLKVGGVTVTPPCDARGVPR